MTAFARSYTVTKGKMQAEGCPSGPLSLSAVHLKSFTKTEEVESEAKTPIQPTSKQGEIKEDRTLSGRVPGRETPPATAVSRIEDKGARSQGRLPELKQQRWDSSEKEDSPAVI